MKLRSLPASVSVSKMMPFNKARALSFQCLDLASPSSTMSACVMDATSSAIVQLSGRSSSIALKHALSSKAKANALIVLDKAELPEPKTAQLRGKFSGLGLSSALIIDGATPQENFALAARNIPNVDVLPVQGINVYDILRRDKLVLTRAAVEALEERFK